MHNMVIAMVVLSCLVQVTAATRAIMLIRISGSMSAWLFLAAAALLMGVRRPVTLYHIFTGAQPGDAVAESIALAISVLMLCGICMIRHLFVRLNESRLDLIASEQQYRLLNETLEERVAQAAAELEEKGRLLVVQGRHAIMGEMLSNIAHQWRQPLNTLGLLAQDMILTFRIKGFDAEILEGHVEKMMETIRYMSKTIDDFRNFFGGGLQRESFSVLDVLQKSMSLLEPSLAAQQIKAELEVEGDRVIDGCPTELSQVLLNIIGNARDALASGHVPDRVVKVRLFTERGKTVVTVADNAGGIPEEILDKVFDPYFTTKGPDHGTGIGLFMSKTIVEKHLNGSISVSNIGSGAEFRIEI